MRRTGRIDVCTTHLSLPVVLNHGQVLCQVFQADLELGVLCAREVKQLNHQQVCLVSELGCLPGVGGQQGADLSQVLLSIFQSLIYELHLDVPAGEKPLSIFVTLLSLSCASPVCPNLFKPFCRCV